MDRIVDWLVKTFLTGDFLASKVRHFLGFLGGMLIGNQLASVDQAAELVDILTRLLTSTEFLSGIGLAAVAERSSAVNKKAKNGKN